MGLLNDLIQTEAAGFLMEDLAEDFTAETTAGAIPFTGALVIGSSSMIQAVPGDEALDNATLYITEGGISLLKGQQITRVFDSGVWMISDVPPAEYGLIAVEVHNMRRRTLGKL